jgi:type II secretory pathway pseudopilin PulG
VIAILSVLTGVASYSYSMVSGRQAEECARKLASTLSHARTTTMGKYKDDITIENTDSGIIVNEDIFVKVDENNDKVSTERHTTVSKSNVTVEYKYNLLDEYQELASGATLSLRFNSGTGALSEPKEATSQLYFKISKNKTVKYVVINSVTGKVSYGNSEDVANYNG